LNGKQHETKVTYNDSYKMEKLETKKDNNQISSPAEVSSDKNNKISTKMNESCKSEEISTINFGKQDEVSPKDKDNEVYYCKKSNLSLKGKPKLVKSPKPITCNKTVSSSKQFYPIRKKTNKQEDSPKTGKSLTKGNFICKQSEQGKKANVSLTSLNLTRSIDSSATPDVVPEHESDHESIHPQFFELPKARLELINSYKASMDKVIESGTKAFSSRTSFHTEQVGQVLQSSNNMIKHYKEPIDKAIKSGSNIINSYTEPINKVIESGSNAINSYKEAGSNTIVAYRETGSNMINSYKESGSDLITSYTESGSSIINSYKESSSNMISSYKETGSDIIKKPVQQVYDSTSEVLSSKVTSITNSVMKVPAIGKYLPWLSGYEEEEEEE